MHGDMRMNTAWKWLRRAAIITAISVCGVLAFVAYGMTRPVVAQSNGYTGITSDAKDTTLSGTLPPTATNVRYVQASVGLGGRLLLYRFNAPLADLQNHAKAEFAAHWDKPTPKISSNTPAPIRDATHYELSLIHI